MQRPYSARTREIWALATVLFVLFFNFPLMQIFNREATVLGIPRLFAFLTGGWLLIILLLYVFVRRQIRPEAGDGTGHHEGGDEA